MQKSTAKIFLLSSCAGSNNGTINEKEDEEITETKTDTLKATKELYSTMLGTWKHNKTLEIQRINAHSYNYDSNGYIEKYGNTWGATILAPSYNIVIDTDGVYFSKNGNVLKNTLGEKFGISYSNLINIAEAKKIIITKNTMAMLSMKTLHIQLEMITM